MSEPRRRRSQASAYPARNWRSRSTPTWEHHGKLVELDANYIGKLERGVISWPSARYREALRAVLGVSSDSALGFQNGRRAVVRLSDVDRKQFLRAAAVTAGMVALGPATALLEGSEPTPVPARVGATEIEQIRTAAQVFESWDFTYGGGLAREAVLAQLRWSAGLLDATVPSHHRAELYSAVGYLAETAAFMAFDACVHNEARRVFQFALACAEQAGDWHLRAAILADMSRQAVYLGQPDAGLTFSEHALVRADRLTATERAMLHTTRARALASMRRVQDTLLAVGAADDHFADTQPANDAPFMAYYDAAQHAGDTGHALADLATTGHGGGEAAQRLATAIAGHTAGYVRSKVMSEVKLASLVMSTGDPIHAAVTGITALEHVDALRSRRAVAGLHELRQRSTAHSKIEQVAQLHHRLNSVLLAV